MMAQTSNMFNSSFLFCKWWASHLTINPYIWRVSLDYFKKSALTTHIKKAHNISNNITKKEFMAMSQTYVKHTHSLDVGKHFVRS